MMALLDILIPTIPCLEGKKTSSPLSLIGVVGMREIKMLLNDV